MDLVDKLHEITARISAHGGAVETEEATKNAFIMPFIGALGYDVFNPGEVIPEFTADIGIKKGEKVDYAIKKEGKIILLIECKKITADLHKEHASQLYRYFSATEARFGVLTNGVIYQFYSDIDESNKMDSKSFFEFNVLDFDEHHVEELKKFSKSAFSLAEILSSASTLKYMGGIVKVLERETSEPSDEFVRFYASKVYDGVLRQSVIDQFRTIVFRAQKQFINDKVNARLKSALSVGEGSHAADIDTESGAENAIEDNNGIVTTQDEIDGFNMVRGILAEIVSVERVCMRDNKSYCAILLDDNNRKPVCRLHFNAKQLYIGLIAGKSEEKVPIETINDIFKHATRIKETVKEYIH
jgi:hypothetical protein